VWNFALKLAPKNRTAAAAADDDDDADAAG